MRTSNIQSYHFIFGFIFYANELSIRLEHLIKKRTEHSGQLLRFITIRHHIGPLLLSISLCTSSEFQYTALRLVLFFFFLPCKVDASIFSFKYPSNVTILLNNNRLHVLTNLLCSLNAIIGSQRLTFLYTLYQN